MRRALETGWARVGLPRPELRAWALYDWANSGYVTTVIATLFPIYFASVVAAELPSQQATSRFALASGAAFAVVAVLSPVLGALADRGGIVKPLLGVFLGLGVLSTAGLALVGGGDVGLGLLLFGLGNVGVTGSLVFSDALLRHVARDDELDRASTAGYALGYLGGGLLLAMQLVLVVRPGWFGLADAVAAMRVSFLMTAAWWLVFSVPLFRRVPEPRPSALTGVPPRVSLRAALQQLRETFRALRGHRQALKVLVAYLLYVDGIGTIIRIGALYGTALGIGQGVLIGVLLLTQAVGIPCALLFGRAAERVGAKAALLFALTVYVGICVFAYFMRTTGHFVVLALMVGAVQGGSQALSRSLFAQMVPRHQATQFFGFFSVFEKVTALVGPLVVAATVELTGSMRGAILSLVFFFVAGGAVLARVDVGAGRRAAREAEARAGLHGRASASRA